MDANETQVNEIGDLTLNENQQLDIPNDEPSMLLDPQMAQQDNERQVKADLNQEAHTEAQPQDFPFVFGQLAHPFNRTDKHSDGQTTQIKFQQGGRELSRDSGEPEETATIIEDPNEMVQVNEKPNERAQINEEPNDDVNQTRLIIFGCGCHLAGCTPRRIASAEPVRDPYFLRSVCRQRYANGQCILDTYYDTFWPNITAHYDHDFGFHVTRNSG